MSDNLTTLAVIGLALASLAAFGLTVMPGLIDTLNRVAAVLP